MAITNNRLTSEQYEQNFADIRPPFENKTAAVVEANRCIFCYDAPCTKSCPTSINIPKFIKQITTDNVKGSAHTIFSANIMGAGCSKVCPVEKLCEGACVYNLLEEEPIQIARLQQYSTMMAMEKDWQLFDRKPVRTIDADVQRVALRKLRQLDAAVTLEDLRVPPGNRLEKLRGDPPESGACGSTTNGASASAGKQVMLTMSRSSTTIEQENR